MNKEEKETRNHEHCHSCQEIIILGFAQELDLFFFFPREIFLQKCIKNQKQPFRVKLSQQNIAIFLNQTKKLTNCKNLKTQKKQKTNSLSPAATDNAPSSRGSSALPRPPPRRTTDDPRPPVAPRRTPGHMVYSKSILKLYLY